MIYQPRTPLAIAIAELEATAKTCEECGELFVYGRKGAVYCSVKCARRVAQRRHRAQLKVAAGKLPVGREGVVCFVIF